MSETVQDGDVVTADH